jgi:hypothetical protein
MRNRSSMFVKVMAVSCAALLSSAPALAQAPASYVFPLQPYPEFGLPVSPIMEGWYDNGDGTYTISFGYLNRNRNSVVHIPLGEDNNLDNSDLNGLQPTVFLPGRQHGVFGITIPAEERANDVWWTIANEGDEVHRVPGRARIGAYELDWAPRAHGAFPPTMWFESRDDSTMGPHGVTAAQTLEARVGDSIELSVNVADDSLILNVDDPQDPRYANRLLRVRWSVFQGEPEGVEFDTGASDNGVVPGPGPAVVRLPDGFGAARVNVTFKTPGEYVFLATSDNFVRGDSRATNQCCWSNAYQRVTVAE